MVRFYDSKLTKKFTGENLVDNNKIIQKIKIKEGLNSEKSKKINR